MVDCKFWLDGYCCHREAPKNAISCIGKASCIAWRDSYDCVSQENYKVAIELRKVKKN